MCSRQSNVTSNIEHGCWSWVYIVKTSFLNKSLPLPFPHHSPYCFYRLRDHSEFSCSFVVFRSGFRYLLTLALSSNNTNSGTWQLFAPRLTLTLISPCRVHSWLCGGDGSFLQRGEILHFADSLYDFQLIAVETLGPINESATSFLYDLGRRISLVSGEDWEPQFLFQRISVAIQRFNAVLLHDGFFVLRPPVLVLLQTLFFSLIFSFLGNMPIEV